MYRLLKYLIGRPVLCSIFFVTVVLLGILSFEKTPIELKPDETLPSLTVSYSWSGATPELILKEVLIPAEEAIMDVKGITKMTSRAARDVATITLEFSRDIKMNFAEVVLKEALNRLQRNLPIQVRRPNITTNVPDEFKKEAIMTVGIYGDSIYRLRQVAEKEILPYLNAIPGVDSVEMWGGVPPQIKISTKLDKLKKYNIGLNNILAQMNEKFFSNKSIFLKKEGKEITLSLSESPKNVKEIQDIVLKKMGDKDLRLKDIANVFLGYEELEREMRFKGKSVLGFLIYKEAKKSSLKMSKLIRARLQKLANKLEKSGINFLIQQDESKELRTQLNKIFKIAFFILMIIFIILMLIVWDFRAAILIFSSVFFSVFTTFTWIYIFGIELNMLTLSGLALGFGLFVDNAVVVFDSILRKREQGMDPKKASVEGAKAVIMPVLSSTITTIIVFFSFAWLFQDRLKLFYTPLAIVITISLLSSIVVSFLLIPSLSSRMRLHTGRRKGIFKKGKFFPFLIRYPLVVIIPIVLIGMHIHGIFLKEVTFGQFWGWSERESIVVNLRFPTGAEYEDIKKSIQEFEKIALSKTFEKEIRTNIYPQGAYMEITFPKEVEYSAYPYQLKQELVQQATNLAGVGVNVFGMDQENYHYNPDFGSFLPYSITIKGFNFEKLMEYCSNVKKSMLMHRRIKDVEIITDVRFWWGGKEKYYKFTLNMDKLARYQIEPITVMYLLQNVINEKSSGNQKVKYDGKELSIEVKSIDIKKMELFDIKNLELYSMDGKPFRIEDLVTISFEQKKGGISRENQEYIAELKWDYMGSAKSGDRYHKTLFNTLDPPPGFKKSLEENRRFLREDEQRQLNLAIWAALGFIFIILGILYNNFFQPLLIMLTIPLALIGVWVGFIIMEYSFDSTADIGVILLFGIVVNNAILLIDNINSHVKKMKNIVEAIVVATKERIRPIFMTSATTVLGMMPLLVFKESGGGNSDIWSSLALCIVGGLTTSTLLILFVLPVFYYYFYKFQRHIENLLARAKKRRLNA